MSLSLRQVRSAADRTRFVELPRQFPGYVPEVFVPPLTFDQRRRLDMAKHPFFRHATGAFWLAEKNGRPAGRISAVCDRLSLERYQDGVGCFGHFLAEDDDVAHTLLATAAGFLREQGCTRLRGPIELSTNYTCGLQVSGFDVQPMIDMNQHPPGQEALLLAAGLEPVQDLLALRVQEDRMKLDRLDRLAAVAQKRAPATLRPLQLRRFEEECRALHQVYERAWEGNYGFVPMTWAEFAYAAKDFRKIVDPATCILAERDGEVIGFALGLPDVNPAIRACNGRLFPFGWLRFLRTFRRVSQIRVVTLGVVPEHRGKGFDARLILEITRSGIAAGYDSAELSWVLEQNIPMMKPLLDIGAEETARYRLFEGPTAR